MRDQDVLVVIPCLNEERTLASVLQRLLADEGSARCLFVVADGGSQDMSWAVAGDYCARLPGRVARIRNDLRFQAAAVNAAVRQFGTGRTWLIRIDAHAHYPEGYITGLIGAASVSAADSVVVPMRSVGATCLQRGIAAAQNSILGTGGSAHRHPGRSFWVEHGHHALFRLDVFERVGGYDPTFTHNEDAELDFRLARAGARIWLDGASAIQYLPRRGFASLFAQYRAYGRGRARTALLHSMKLRLRQQLPLAVPLTLLLAAFAPLAPVLAMPAAAWLSACLAAGGMFAIRDRSVCSLASGPALAVMHFGWAVGFWSQLLAGARAPARIEGAARSGLNGVEAEWQGRRRAS